MRAVGMTLLVAACLALLVAPVWPPLNAAWTGRYSVYNYGYLVLAVAVSLAVHECRRAPLGEFRPSLLGLAAFAAATAAMSIARIADIQRAAQLLVFILPLAALWAIAGGSVAKRFVLPAAYCLFALPVWERVNDLLRNVTIAADTLLIRATSLPAYIETNFIHLPSGTIEVSNGCGGFRYFIVACALATYYGAVNYSRWWLRVSVVVVAAAVAILGNWVRVYVIVVAGYLSHMRSFLITVDHSVFGWVLFFVVFVPLVYGLRRVEHRFRFAVEAVGGRAGETGRSVFAAWTARHYVTAGILSAILLGGAWMNHAAVPMPNPAASASQLSLPGRIGAWAANGAWDDATMPRYAGADRRGGAWYRQDGRRVGLYVAQYDVQLQNKEIIHIGNSPVGTRGKVVRRSTARVALGDGGHREFGELEVVDSGSGRRLVWYGYDIAGHRAASGFWAKYYQVLGALKGRWDARVLVMSEHCGADCGEARQSLSRFVQAAGASI